MFCGYDPGHECSSRLMIGESPLLAGGPFQHTEYDAIKWLERVRRSRWNENEVDFQPLCSVSDTCASVCCISIEDQDSWLLKEDRGVSQASEIFDHGLRRRPTTLRNKCPYVIRGSVRLKAPICFAFSDHGSRQFLTRGGVGRESSSPCFFQLPIWQFTVSALAGGQVKNPAATALQFVSSMFLIRSIGYSSMRFRTRSTKALICSGVLDGRLFSDGRRNDILWRFQKSRAN
jgi:hypothetical protein